MGLSAGRLPARTPSSPPPSVPPSKPLSPIRGVSRSAPRSSSDAPPSPETPSCVAPSADALGDELREVAVGSPPVLVQPDSAPAASNAMNSDLMTTSSRVNLRSKFIGRDGVEKCGDMFGGGDRMRVYPYTNICRRRTHRI